MNEIIQKQKIRNTKEDVDLLSLLLRFWEKRKFILLITGCFMALGLFVAIFSPKVYKSTCVFVPQFSKNGSGGISSLAAMAGINIGDMSNSSVNVSPRVYPNILKNINYKRDLIYTKIKFQKWDDPISLYDYYTKKEYAEFNLLRTIKKYTLGLPSLLISKIIKNKDNNDDSFKDDNDLGVQGFTNDEFKCAQVLSHILSIKLNDKEGYITITANMPEAVASAQVCQAAYDLLQKYVTEFKIAKAIDNRRYVQERYEEAKEDFMRKQELYARESDANRVLSTKVASIDIQRVEAEYLLSKSIYNELATQLLQANLKVKEDTPLLAAVKPVEIPVRKSKPNRPLILAIWTILGLIVSSGSVLAIDYMKRQGCKWPKNW